MTCCMGDKMNCRHNKNGCKHVPAPIDFGCMGVGCANLQTVQVDASGKRIRETA